VVDWTIARGIARLAAAAGDAPPLHADVVGLVEELAPEVGGYVRLMPSGGLPRPENVSRADWAEANLTTMSGLLDPVAERLADRLTSASPVGGPLRGAAGAAVGAEAGLVMGYLSQRVLGQYELSLLQPESPARLLFVGPNIARAASELDVPLDAFLRWIVLHELTHVFQFAGVGWLRPHLGGLLRLYLAEAEVRVEAVAGSLRRRIDPLDVLAAFRDGGGLLSLVQSPEQKAALDRIQAVMAVIEGYSEHVMDALGARLLPDQARLREALERRRRNRSAPERILQRLLGMDLKLRQYELGKAFSDAVVARGGLERLNLVWTSPDALPTLNELERPDRWLARMERPVLGPPTV